VNEKEVAKQIVEIMPHLLSKMSADMRCAGVGMDPPHFRILAILADEPHNLSELAEHQGVSLATVSQTIATLTERGWVEREPKTTDRRIVQVKLSPLGEKMLEDMHCLLRQKVSDLLTTLLPSELVQLSDGLVALQKVLGEASGKEQVDPMSNREETGLKLGSR
jgi:DNA-binding MarR family transcriptional regulator